MRLTLMKEQTTSSTSASSPLLAVGPKNLAPNPIFTLNQYTKDGIWSKGSRARRRAGLVEETEN